MSRRSAARYKDVFAFADPGHRRRCEQTGGCVPGAEAERSWLLSELRRAESRASGARLLTPSAGPSSGSGEFSGGYKRFC